MTWEIDTPPGGDSFTFLRTLADSAVDVVLTDPPYAAHVHANMTSGTAVRDAIDAGKHGGIPRIQLDFDPLSSYAFAADLVRAAKRWAIAFCAVEDFGAYRAAAGEVNYVRGGIWYKPNSMGQLTKDRPAAAYEGLAIMHRKTTKKAWNGRGSYAHWAADSEEFPSEESYFQQSGTRGEKARHPNQKPLELCLELVAKFSNRGETILDPFSGSGRIGEACLALGRHYIGLDQDPAWVAAGRDRLANLEIPFGAISDVACLKLCAAPRRPALPETAARRP